MHFDPNFNPPFILHGQPFYFIHSPITQVHFPAVPLMPALQQSPLVHNWMWPFQPPHSQYYPTVGSNHVVHPVATPSERESNNLAVSRTAQAATSVFNPVEYDAHNLKPRRRQMNKNLVCKRCKTQNTPEWRSGPAGKRTLCNRCGLAWKRSLKKLQSPATTQSESAKTKRSYNSKTNAPKISSINKMSIAFLNN